MHCIRLGRLLLGAACMWTLAASPVSALPKTTEELRAIFDNLTKTTVVHGSIPALFNPPTIPVSDAANMLEADDQMLLVAFPSGIRMYPQSFLVWHEVVNEYIDGEAFCVSYAPISGSFAAYRSRVDGTNLTFDAEGRLYNNNSVLIDRNTGSLWMQLAGIAFDGPLAGKGLRHIPVLWTSWELARKAFPNAKVMATPRGTARRYGQDPYGSYRSSSSYYQDESILYPLATPLDHRMPPKTRIYGVELETLSFAVDIESIKAVGALNFFLGPYPLLVVYDPTIGSVRVFDRTVWDKPTLFKMENGRLTDIESASVWNMDGKAISGNLKDASMNQLFGVYAFWFSWAATYPDTLTVPGPTVVPDAALIKGKL